MKDKLIRKEETAQGIEVKLYQVYGGYKVVLENTGIFYFEELKDADMLTGLVAMSDFEKK